MVRLVRQVRLIIGRQRVLGPVGIVVRGVLRTEILRRVAVILAVHLARGVLALVNLLQRLRQLELGSIGIVIQGSRQLFIVLKKMSIFTIFTKTSLKDPPISGVLEQLQKRAIAYTNQ